MKQDLKDSLARKKIAEELSTSFFVEAGAGSGKTYCLVERMVNLIKSGSAEMGRIAAVTFTRKAAAELNERFQIGLEEALTGDHTEDEGESIKEALSNLEQIFIGTIHSFCAKILRERPVEAGVDPGFTEIEEDKDLSLAETAWAHYLEDAKLDGSSSLGFIDNIGIKAPDLRDGYFKFIQYPDVEIVVKDVAKPDFTETKKAILELLDFFKEVMPGVQPGKGLDKLQEIIVRSISFVDSGYMDSDRKFAELLGIMAKTPKITQNRWPCGNSKEYLEKMKKFQSEVIGPALKSWQQYIHKPLTEFLAAGAEHYRKWRRDHSMLNFSDLLINTAELLRGNAEVRGYFKNRFTHILVDEFQDTDPVQAEIILFLTGSDINVDNWKKVTPAPGSLFVVGDPKQSIYRFRRADIDIYNLVKDIFNSKSGEVLDLYSNFRSLPFMQETVNDVFTGILPENETRYQAKFSPLNTVKSLNDECLSGVMENPIGKVYRDNAREIAKIDAARIANWIKGAIGGSFSLQDDNGNAVRPGPGDFLILTRYKKNLKVYAKALEMAGIPYDISGGESFSQSLELAEVYRLFRAIDDYRDPVALITALRGIFFGISDDRLYQFKKAGGVFLYYAEVPEGFDEFDRAFKVLKDYSGIIRDYGPSVAAEMIIEDTGILPLSVCEEEGLTKAGNIYKVLELLKDSGAEGLDVFGDLVRRLGEMLDSGGIESSSLASSVGDPVRIMNLHKAKGLEAPIVILADPMGAGADFEPDHHITRTGKSSALGYFTISRPVGSFAREIVAIPPDWEEGAGQEKLYEEAEKARLEYVAVTRAKNILLVSTYREGSRKKAWEFMYGYLSGKDKIEADGEIVSGIREVVDISATEWEESKERIAEGAKGASDPSYSLTSVTTEAKEGYVFEGNAGSGMSWGTIVHKALELVGRGGYDKLRVLGRSWIEEEGRDPKELERLVGVVDRFMESELWDRIQRASRKYFEVPFGLEESEASKGLEDSEGSGDSEKGDGVGSSIVYGVIDLVFEEEGEWVIVDYKTDEFGKDEERKRAYQRQVDMYGKYWERISGERVKERALVGVLG